VVTGKRLVLTTLLAGLVLAVVGGLSNSTGQTQETPGLTYGGLKDQYPAWLRLAPGRGAIAALHVEWAADPKRCSNRKGYESVLYGGFENFHAISLSPTGTFKRTIVDRYRDQGDRYEERMSVSGTVGEVVTGSISGTVRIVKRSGQVVRCSFGPQGFRLVD
jgi:hypothetical protein